MLEQTYFTFEETKPINYYHNDRTQPPKQLLENANYDKALFKKSADIECNISIFSLILLIFNAPNAPYLTLTL